MLTNIILNNYTTFINETKFDFKATNIYHSLEDTNVAHNVLKGALFVGENASGKTQTLKSIVFLLDILLGNSDTNFLEKKSLYTSGKNYNLTYTFLVDEKNIEYNIELEENTIKSEKLFLDQKLLIERLHESGKIHITEERKVEINNTISLLKQEYYKTKFDNEPTLIKWFTYLRNSIYINCLDGTTKIYNTSNLDEQILDKYLETKGVKDLNKLLNDINYNSEMVYDNILKQKNNKIESNKKMLGLKKKGTDVTIPIYLESKGNKNLLNIITPLSYALKNNCILIIDEFSSGLNNRLEEAVLKYFFNHSKESQIFIVSHSTSLIDNYIFRPDQIFTFKFDPNKGTIINRVSDESPRISQDLEKMYLNGVFDGRPTYNTKK